MLVLVILMIASVGSLMIGSAILFDRDVAKALPGNSLHLHVTLCASRRWSDACRQSECHVMPTSLPVLGECNRSRLVDAGVGSCDDGVSSIEGHASDIPSDPAGKPTLLQLILINDDWGVPIWGRNAAPAYDAAGDLSCPLMMVRILTSSLDCNRETCIWLVPRSSAISDWDAARRTAAGSVAARRRSAGPEPRR